MPPDERRTQGKALREAVPREAHGHWKAPKDRRDIVDLLNEFERGPDAATRADSLRADAAVAFHFFSRNGPEHGGRPRPPPSRALVQACGDCHLKNFGGFATPKRNIIFDINDFDETSPAPWEWDVKRLAASFVLAGRQIRLLESDAARAVRATVCSYREHMSDYASMRALEVWYDTIDVDRFLKAMDLPERREQIRAAPRECRGKERAGVPVPQARRASAGRRRGSRTIRR